MLEAVSKAQRLLAERQHAEVRQWAEHVGDIHSVTGGECTGAAGCEFRDSQIESSNSPNVDLNERERVSQQSDMPSGCKRILSLADVVAPAALPLRQPAREPAGDSATSGAYSTSKPRKMHSLRLTELRWDALANRREQRRNLHLRGLPPKLCKADALEVLLKAEGLWEAVAGLRLLPHKAAQPGCAVLNVKDSRDVQRLAKYFHGRQFGAGAPVAVSFAVPGFMNSLRPGQNPAKVQSSLDPIGVASSLTSSLSPAAGKTAWQLRNPRLVASTDVLGMYPLACPIGGSGRKIVEDSIAATTMDSLALEGSTSLCASSASGSSDESEDGDSELLFMPPPGLEGFAPHLAC